MLQEDNEDSEGPSLLPERNQWQAYVALGRWQRDEASSRAASQGSQAAAASPPEPGPGPVPSWPRLEPLPAFLRQLRGSRSRSRSRGRGDGDGGDDGNPYGDVEDFDDVTLEEVQDMLGDDYVIEREGEEQEGRRQRQRQEEAAAVDGIESMGAASGNGDPIDEREVEIADQREVADQQEEANVGDLIDVEDSNKANDNGGEATEQTQQEEEGPGQVAATAAIDALDVPDSIEAAAPGAATTDHARQGGQGGQQPPQQQPVIDVIDSFGEQTQGEEEGPGEGAAAATIEAATPEFRPPPGIGIGDQTAVVEQRQLWLPPDVRMVEPELARHREIFRRQVPIGERRENMPGERKRIQDMIDAARGRDEGTISYTQVALPLDGGIHWTTVTLNAESEMAERDPEEDEDEYVGTTQTVPDTEEEGGEGAVDDWANADEMDGGAWRSLVPP